MFRKFLSIASLIALALGGVWTPHATAAELGGAVKFEITAPSSARTDEAIDVTIRAVDASGNTATGYRGSIIFATDYIADIVPMPGRSIAFTADDSGEKKFSKGVTFKKAGKQKLFVSDVTADIVGEVSILVEAGNGGTTTSNETLTVITPENNATITGDSVMISGTTRKNSRVAISLNGSDLGTVVSDDTGLFTKEVTGVSQENNILKVSLLDADNAVLASAPDVTFTKSVSSSSIYGVTITPSTTVQPSTNVTINIEAVAGLTDVTATLDGTQLKATEGASGKYSVSTIAPQKPGSYPINVSAKTLTAGTTTRDAAATLTVEAALANTGTTNTGTVLIPQFKNVRATTDKDRITFTFGIDNVPANLNNFKIMYGTGASALNSEIVTQAASSILSGGLYTWYVPNLPANTYTFKIYGQDLTGLAIQNLVSDPITATIGVASCTISNVGPIQITSDNSKSVMRWDPVAGAIAYNIYKVDADGKYTLFEKVTTPTYTLFLSQGAVKYENFAIKALCGDGTESKDYSNASRVQTGPGLVAFLVVISGFLGVLLMRRRNSV